MINFISLSGGHGGTDSGATGNGYLEKELSLEQIELIEKYLKEGWEGFEIIVQQEKTAKGVFRSNTAYGVKTGFYLSCHFNSNSGTPGTGTEVLQGNYGSDYCNAINKAMAKYFTNRGVKEVDTDNYYMLRECGFDMILETCFINNSNDMKIYQKNKKAIAKDIATVIANQLGLKKKSTKTDSPRTFMKLNKKCSGYYNELMSLGSGGCLVWEDVNATKSTGNHLKDVMKTKYIPSRFIKTIKKNNSTWHMYEYLNTSGKKRYYCQKITI